MWQGLTTPSLGKSHVKQDKKMHDYVGYKEKSHYLCIAFKRKCGLEVWVSGLNQQFAKLPCGLPYRGFESPTFRKLSSEKCTVGRFI